MDQNSYLTSYSNDACNGKEGHEVMLGEHWEKTNQTFQNLSTIGYGLGNYLEHVGY